MRAPEAPIRELPPTEEAAVREPAAGAPRHRLTLARRRALMGWLFMVPLAIFNLTVILGPSLASLYYAFTDWSGIGPAEFTGLENFRQLLTDSEVHEAFAHNIVWTCIFLTVPISMGLFGAYLLSQVKRFTIAFRVAYFIPYVIASVVNGAIWQNLLDPTQGVGPTLAEIGIPIFKDVAFLGNPTLALPSVAFVDNWHWWGFLVVLFLAAMQSVDTELYEAARVDGATRWQEFRHVTIPSIRPTLAFVMIMTIIWSFLVFDYVWILTQGGPAGATEVVATVLYKNAFSHFQAGYAAAIGLAMSFVSGIVVMGYLHLRRRGWEI
jgi:raffinose/stachyose/melibiose transport system permease protein